jgi:hypothetical protein
LNLNTDLKLFLFLAVAFSLATLGALSSNSRLPTIQLANAITQPCQVGSSGACSEPWYPAGPEMSTEQGSVFTSCMAEYSNLGSTNPSLDLTDCPVPAAIGTSQLSGPGYYLTQPIAEQGYYEIQFMMANTFWNCQFQYGNSACGVQIRQGIAHMIDKTAFASQAPGIPPGDGVPIDNPVPTSAGGGLLSADSCGWDASFPETNSAGAACIVGGGSSGTNVGGAAYHLGTATGVASISCAWCQAPGSADLNAAAQHFVNAGLATGFNSSTSVLTGVVSPTGLTIPTFFVVNSDPARLELGQSLEAQICYLFTGSYTTPCAYLATVLGEIGQFPGFTTCVDTQCLTWWFYTAAYSGVTFYDRSLYYTYNSRFVSASCVSPGTPSCLTQQIGGGYCSNSSVNTAIASNYMYICSPTYDNLSNELETSSCLSASGDPVAGATTNMPTGPNNGLCSNGQLSSHSAAIQAENYFGENVFTLPIYELGVQFGYLQCQPPGPCTTSNSWTRAINDASLGLPNYFTWLNAYNPGPATPGTIRQAFEQTTRSVNPYIASTLHDLYIVNNVYDSLFIQNPLSTSQYIDWMAQSESPVLAVSYTGGLSGPPAGTVATYRFTLRTDLTWQDNTEVTAYDVAFSYLSMVDSGAYLGTSASSITGITVLNPYQFDISVSSNGPFELDTLTATPVLPGYWWNNAGGPAWASAVAACTRSACADLQFTLSGSNVQCAGACSSFGGSIADAENLMTVNPSYVAPSYDPIASHTFVGSGPWECGIVTSTGSGTCTPTGSGNGQSSYTLSAYTGYFRSSYRAAEWIWSYENDQTPIVAAAFVGSCFNAPVNLFGSCGHWQQGIGNPSSGTVVTVSTVSTVDDLYGVNFVAPFNWLTNPPLGVGAFAPVLFALQAFDGSTILTPAPTTGTPCNSPNTYYNC